MRNATLEKSRVGLACLMTSATWMLMDGRRSASSLAVPVPNSDSSCTSTAVLATPLAALLISPRPTMASSTHLPKPGASRKTFFRPRRTMRSDTPTSIMNGVLYLAAAWVAGRAMALEKQPT